MTVDTMIVELFNQLGRPSNLRPFMEDGETIDIGSYGATRLLGWLNRGYRRVLAWRFPNGRIVRFRAAERILYVSGTVLEGGVTAGAARSVTLDGTFSAVSQAYKGWIVEIEGGTGAGQKRQIISYSDTRVATVHKAWDTVPDATSTISLKKNFLTFGQADGIDLSSTDEILAVMAVVDMETGSPLTRADRTMLLQDVVTRPGPPAVYQDFDGGLAFDSVVPDERAYEVRYHGFPGPLVGLEDEPQIPAQFHEAVLLWAVWWGLREYQEFAGAYSTKRDLEDTMVTALQQFDMANEREDISLYIGGR